MYQALNMITLRMTTLCTMVFRPKFFFSEVYCSFASLMQLLVLRGVAQLCSEG